MTLARLLLVECPSLAAPDVDDGGRHLRRFAGVVESLASVCPWVDAIRPGVCALPLRGPTRYFGSEQAVAGLVRRTVATALDGGPDGQGGGGEENEIRLGIADGLFAAALAAEAGVAVPVGETPAFLAPWPVDVLGDRELADLLVRLGLGTLGAFAGVTPADVLARFGAAGVRCHRVARGAEGELPGYRVPGLGRRLVAVLGRDLALVDHQPGFWGGTSAADERAAEALTVLQRRLGVEAVTVPVLDGGRGPADRCRLVPWRPRGATARQEDAKRGRRGDKERGGQRDGRPPWPGRLPPPAPARVLGWECAAELRAEGDLPVGVTSSGLLTGRPRAVSVAGGPWREVAAWSAPWPVEERWWSRGRRRAARLQVLTGVSGPGGETAYLLLVERGQWRVEAVYD